MPAKKKGVIKVGSTAKITSANYINHGLNLGDVVKVTSLYPGNNSYFYVNNNGGFAVAKSHLVLVSLDFTKKSVEKEKESLLAEVAVLDSKLAFLDETDSETGNEQEYRIFSTLTLIENGDLTKRQKAQQIAALLEDR